MLHVNRCTISSSAVTMTQWHSIGVSVNDTTLLLLHNGHQLVTSGSCIGSESYDNYDNITAALRVTIGNSTGLHCMFYMWIMRCIVSVLYCYFVL